MQIAFLLFNRLTALDAVGPYEVLSRLPGAETVFVGERPGAVRSDAGLTLVADAALADVSRPDVVVVPGGPGQAALMTDGPVQRWLLAVERTSSWMTSVCTGSLILGAAGLLDGRRATTHWLALEQLQYLGATAVNERVVTDGKYVTAAGVSAGIDMALHLAEVLCGEAVAQSVQLGIEYDPQPPFAAGSIDTAPEPVVAALRARSRLVLTGR